MRACNNDAIPQQGWHRSCSRYSHQKYLPNMRYQPIHNELFKLNRKRFTKEMQPNSIAIFHSNDQMPRCGDTVFPFRQNSNLFYLSGLDQEETIVVLFPDCIKEDFREVAFIKRTSEKIAIWEGEKYSKERARQISGIEKVLWLDEMDAVYNELILLSKRIYLNSNENDRASSEVENRDMRMGKALLQKYPFHKYHRSQPILKKLVMRKSQHEIDTMQAAIDITEKAFRRVLGFIKPNVWEYEIEAEITHEFIRNRARGHAYEPIIGSGRNACVLHYIENSQQCKAGDVVLMDFGAEYGNYAADLTRAVPVSGQFTKRQKEVYNSVLHVMKEAKQMLVPGNTIEEYNKEVGKIMESQLLKLKLITKHDIEKQDKNWPAYKRYFMHGTSHHLGLDVHDLANRYDTFKTGMVFTCEPGIYILEENLGIRLENNLVLTDNLPIDLMANIPLEAEEIEMLMNMKVEQVLN
jgi:Xaa-Pro aminopeptidase